MFIKNKTPNSPQSLLKPQTVPSELIELVLKGMSALEILAIRLTVLILLLIGLYKIIKSVIAVF